jgi:hypothetical protein
VRADLVQVGREVLDEGERGLEQIGLVARLVRVEPVPVVVLLQIGEKGEQLASVTMSDTSVRANWPLNAGPLRCSRSGAVAEWLRSGLQSRVHRFDSGRRL